VIVFPIVFLFKRVVLIFEFKCFAFSNLLTTVDSDNEREDKYIPDRERRSK
jgi:hypothetical protein